MRTSPQLESGGRTYERSNGGWLDVHTNMSVAEAAGQRLDRLAQQDVAFWKRCLHEDAHRRTRGRSSRSGYGLSADFFGQSRDVRLTADIAAGWRRTTAHWRYSASQAVNLRGNWTLHCTVEVVEDSRNFTRKYAHELWQQTDDGVYEVDADWFDTTWESAVPSFSPIEERERDIAFCVQDSQAVFEIPIFSAEEEGTLNRHLRWKRTNGLWRFRDTRVGIFERLHPIPRNVVSRPFRFTMTAVLHQPPREPVGPTWEHDLPFPSAGLPSLGKRR